MKNLNIFSVTVSSIIPLLILGPLFPDLIVCLLSLVFLFYVFKYKLFFYFTKKPIILFFIFCAYCILVSIFVAKDVLLSFESSLFYFRIGVFSCLIWYLLEKNTKILEYFYYSFLASFSVLIVDGYVQFFTGYNTIGIQVSGIRVSSFFVDELIMGSYLSRLYPMAFALLLLKRQNNKIELSLITIFFFLTSGLIYISGERTALFFHVLSVTFITLLIKKLKLLRCFIFIGLFAITAILSLQNNDLKKRMLISSFESIGINKETKYIFSQGHNDLVVGAYKMFLDKPVFGHGPKMFREICKDKKYSSGVSHCSTHPHNFYIQLLAETGIIGFMFLFSVFIYVIYCALRQIKTIVLKEKRYLTDYQVCLLASLLITVWPLSPNGNFFNNWLAICYSLPFGFYLHSIYGKNRRDQLKE